MNIPYLALIRIRIILSHVCTIQCHLSMKRYRRGICVCHELWHKVSLNNALLYGYKRYGMPLFYHWYLNKSSQTISMLTRNWNRVFRQRCAKSLKHYYASYSYTSGVFKDSRLSLKRKISNLEQVPMKWYRNDNRTSYIIDQKNFFLRSLATW